MGDKGHHAEVFFKIGGKLIRQPDPGSFKRIVADSFHSFFEGLVLLYKFYEAAFFPQKALVRQSRVIPDFLDCLFFFPT
jgi:hypothetical protein